VFNKTAIVTGASQGIGRSTAIRLAKDFSTLALVARGKENLQAVAGEVKKTGAPAIILDIDLADPSAGKTVVEETLKAFGRIDALLNSAGAVPQIDIFAMTDQQWHNGTELKLHGARRLTIAAWPSLKEASGVTTQVPGSQAMENGDPSKTAVMAASRERPCFLMVER
jgi:3-oxoacyl-[acyl-carrier protein] reductase